MTHMDEKHAQAEALIQEGRTAEAVKLLFELIVAHAEAKRFDQAENLRERLMEVDEMALTEIIRSAEIIEAGRETALDADHMKTWSHLYDGLTPEETNAFFFALKEIRFDAGEILLKQGEIADRLVLPDTGHLKLFFSEGDRQNLIQTIEPGTPVGQESLLSKTVSTACLAAQTPSTVRILKADILPVWKSDIPGLHSKILTYCEKTHRVPQLLAQSQQDRRAADRVALSGRVDVQILDTQGDPVAKPFRGEMHNVSTGGISFYIKATAKAANFLMDRTLQLAFRLPTAEKPVAAKGRARVLAVKDRHFGDYSVHCKLLSPIPDQMIENIGRGEEDNVPQDRSDPSGSPTKT